MVVMVVVVVVCNMEVGGGWGLSRVTALVTVTMMWRYARQLPSTPGTPTKQPPRQWPYQFCVDTCH